MTERGIVYQIDCSCGGSYVGETKRLLKVRIKEHQNCVRDRIFTNGIANHMWNGRSPTCDINWSGAKILHRERSWSRRKFIEALYIEKNASLNLDTGNQNVKFWGSILK